MRVLHSRLYSVELDPLTESSGMKRPQASYFSALQSENILYSVLYSLTFKYLAQGPPHHLKRSHHPKDPIFYFLLSSPQSPTQTSYTTSLLQFYQAITEKTLIMVAQTAAFQKAVEDSRKLKAKPNNDELLEVPTYWPSPPIPFCTSIRGK